MERRLTSRLAHFSIVKSLVNFRSLKSLGTELGYILIFFLLTAGTLNALTNMNAPGIGSQIIVINAAIQSVTETAILFFAYFLGAIGVLALYRSGRQTIRARSAEMFFVVGIILIALSLVLGYELLYIKCPPYGSCG
jgi:hypothetical protein